MTRTLAEIYADIPSFDCKPGCTDCCGTIPVSFPSEAAAFAPSAMQHAALTGARNGQPITSEFWQTTAASCPKANRADASGKACSIHDARPFVCRIFGTVSAFEVPAGNPAAQLICPHGRRPKRPLSAAQANSLMREYFEAAAEAAKARKATAGD